VASSVRVSAKCPDCGSCTHLEDEDIEQGFCLCGYCSCEIELKDAELFNVDTGARFDRDELGIDPELDQED